MCRCLAETSRYLRYGSRLLHCRQAEQGILPDLSCKFDLCVANRERRHCIRVLELLPWYLRFNRGWRRLFARSPRILCLDCQCSRAKTHSLGILILTIHSYIANVHRKRTEKRSATGCCKCRSKRTLRVTMNTATTKTNFSCFLIAKTRCATRPAFPSSVKTSSAAGAKRRWSETTGTTTSWFSSNVDGARRLKETTLNNYFGVLIWEYILSYLEFTLSLRNWTRLRERNIEQSVNYTLKSAKKH